MGDGRGRPKAGELLRIHHSPLTVAGVAFLALLVMWDSSRTAFSADQGEHPWLDWVVLAFIAYSTLGAFVLVPRVIAPQAWRRATDPSRVPLLLASIRLAMAVTPFMVSFACVAAGADQLAATVALFVSAGLLVAYVRGVRSTAPTS